VKLNRSSAVDCDVLISGAGLMGSAFALALARSELRMILIESEDPPADTRATPERVSAVNLASQQMLTRLGVWDNLSDHSKTPFETIETWDAGSAGSIRFDAADLGLKALGHIVSNHALRLALHRALEASATHSIFFNQEINSLEHSDEGVRVTLANGNQLNTRLVVGADGPHSTLRQLAKISMTDADYGQTAVVATVRPSEHHGNSARQRFLPDGPLAFLPLANGRCSIVWSVPNDRAPDLLKLDDSAFGKALEKAFDQRLGQIQTVSSRISFPLQRRHADTYIGDRVALIGDAAHTVHPLAGLGANQGFSDAAGLAEVILAAASENRDFACRSVLRRYERWRRGENALIIEAIEGFHRLFGSTSETAARVRGMGLDITNHSAWVKGIIMRHAVGLSGDLPALAKP